MKKVIKWFINLFNSDPIFKPKKSEPDEIPFIPFYITDPEFDKRI